MAVNIQGIRSLPAIPSSEQRYLSLNLAIVSLTDALEVARDLGFAPQLVLVAYRSGISEIHALLWEGAIEETPVNWDETVDAIADRVDSDGIRHCWGRHT